MKERERRSKLTWRHSIAKQHDLKPIYNKETNVTTSTYEQAKKLFLSLSFGGSYAVWRQTYDAQGDDIIEVCEMEKEMGYVMDRIYKDNADMIADVSQSSQQWLKKSTQSRKRSIVGTVGAVYGTSSSRMLSILTQRTYWF